MPIPLPPAGDIVAVPGATSSKFKFVASSPGTYDISIRVTDSLGNSVYDVFQPGGIWVFVQALPTSSPIISILSPANTTYAAIYNPYAAIPLIFETNESLSWVGYSLDGGSNVTVPENGTLLEIPKESRSLTLYANDTAGNWAAPQTVYYDIAFNLGPAPEPFPTVPVAAASVASVIFVGAGLLFYLKKRKQGAVHP